MIAIPVNVFVMDAQVVDRVVRDRRPSGCCRRNQQQHQPENVSFVQHSA
jgi:hypothetical protein